MILNKSKIHKMIGIKAKTIVTRQIILNIAFPVRPTYKRCPPINPINRQRTNVIVRFFSAELILSIKLPKIQKTLNKTVKILKQIKLDINLIAAIAPSTILGSMFPMYSW